MLRKLNAGIAAGSERIKWFFSVIAERIKIEIAVIRLLGKSEHYDRERKRHLESIGERVFEFRDSRNVMILDDPLVKDSLRELEKLEEQISLLRKEAEDITALEV